MSADYVKRQGARARSAGRGYTWTGLAMLVAGGLTFVVAALVFEVPWVAAFGVSLLILGFICVVLGRTIPSVSPEASALLLETGMDNINSMLEELGLRARCVYLPSSLAGGKPKALIPLHSNPALPRIADALPRRLIVRFGTQPNDLGLLVSTLGTSAVSLLEKPLSGNSAVEVEAALSHLLRGVMDVADAVSVTYEGNIIRVEMQHPRLADKPGWARDCLGGALTSVVATVVAEAWQKPLAVRREEESGGRGIVELEVLP